MADIHYQSMRLGYDLRPFLCEETGVGTYLKNLLFHLAKIDETNEYFLLSSSWKDRFPAEKIPSFTRMKFRDLRIPVRLLNALWQKRRWPPLDLFFRTKLDMTHSATPLVLPTAGKKLITVHDLFFMDFPELAGEEAGRIFLRLATASFQDADGILTSSHFASIELIARFALEEKKVRVVYPGLDRRFLEEVPAAELKATRKRCNLPPAFLLFVGAQVPRKNLVRFLDALKIVHLHGIQIPLVMIGPEGEDTKAVRTQAEKLGLGHWVMSAGYLAEREVRDAYRLATAFVLPSLCEGFGLPLVEAMASGVPVAASRTSAIPEVCRDAAVYFQPENPESMAEKVVSLIEDEVLRKKLIVRGRERARDFSWDRAAAETLEFYEQVVRGI
ncbi:MAG: glycosyltransferase family 1 protein [Candidatus Aminicenantales bacterium]